MDTLSLVDPNHDESFEHFVSLLGVEPRLAGTFSPENEAELQKDWDQWGESLFLPILAPAFVKAFECGIRSRTDELQNIDSELDLSLPSSVRKRSIKAASPFFEGKTKMQGNREWLRYLERVDSGESPGHLTVAFALQSALYHVAMIPALSSYTWFEFRSRGGKGIPSSPTDQELTIFARILPNVAVALNKDSGDSDQNGHTLRVL